MLTYLLGGKDVSEVLAMAVTEATGFFGSGAGRDGGRIDFAGTAADLVAARSTLTGQYLAAYVGA